MLISQRSARGGEREEKLAKRRSMQAVCCYTVVRFEEGSCWRCVISVPCDDLFREL